MRLINLLIKFVFLFSGMLFIGSAFGQTKPKVDLEYDFSVGSYSGMLNYYRVDIDIPGLVLAPEAAFTYNGAKINKDWGYGNGWTFTYNMLYELDTLNNVHIYKKDGSKHIFTKTEDGYIAPSSAPYDQLEEYSSGKYRLKVKGFNTLYYYFDDKTHKRLTAIEDLKKKRTILTYTEGLLTMVEDPVGRKLVFQWNKGHLVQILEENTPAKRSFSYSYDERGNMIKMTNPLGHSVKYSYDPENRMVFYADENGNPFKIEYKSGQVVKKVTTCMSSVAFTYDVTNRKTFVLEEVEGQKIITTYAFDDQGRNIERVGNCCGYKVKQEFDDKNNVIKRVNGLGNPVFFLYDAKGNVKKETNALGEAVKFTYDSVTYKILSRTDELGNTTTYDYDENGNVTKVVYPLGITESYTYDEYGNMLEHTNKNGFVTTYSYDVYGYPATITYPDKTTKIFDYDALGNLLSEKDENGNVTTFEYDKMNQPVKSIDPMDKASEIGYDAKGNQIWFKDANGNVTRYEYDPMDRLISTTTPMGIKTTTTYDDRGNVLAETDGMGNETRYTYNSFDLVTSETDPEGNVKYYVYDAAGRLIEESDKMGNYLTYQYDKAGRVVKKINPLGQSLTYVYNSRGNLISETDGDGYTTTYQYDALGRKISMIDPLGNKESYGLDNMSHLVLLIDKNGNETKYYFDKRGRKYKTEAPLNDVVEFTFDAVGNELTRALAPGIINKYKYDKLNRKIEETSPMGAVTTIEYDAVGNEIKKTFPNGNYLEKVYDKDYRLLSKSDREGTIATYTYNKNGLVTKETDSDGVPTLKRYNKIGLQTEEEDANGNVKKTLYNPNGLPESITDENLRVTRFQYNAGGVVTKSVSPDGEETFYEFDARGNLISITDPKGNKTSFTFDGAGRKVATIFSNGSTEKYEYDPNGNVKSRMTPDGTITYEYDALNRQIQRKLPGGTTSEYSYDALSRMTSASNENVTVTFTFDNDNRLLKETVGEKSISYAYDYETRKNTITYPSGKVFTEELDYANRPVKVLQGSNEVASFTYEGNRIVKKTLGNGLVTDYAFNEMGDIEQISVNAGSVMQLKYDYDVFGNVLSKEVGHNPQFSEAYAYNGKEQLTFYQKGELTQDGIPNPTNTIDYSYDKLGNLVSLNDNGTTSTYSANSLNQYTRISSGQSAVTPSWSATGNLISYGNERYSYDAESRLTKAGEVTYTYDAFGRRYQRISGGSTTTYYYYKDQLITEQDNAGNTIEYIYAGESDKLLAMINEGNTYYFHINELGSVSALSNSSGDVVEFYEYTPYGEVRFYDAEYNQINKSGFGNKKLFAGATYDFTTGLYYMRSREYHPVLGRFIQRDPILFAGGTLNLYEYVHSNPVNYTDPFGLEVCYSRSSEKDIGKKFRTGIIGRAFGRLGGIVFKGGIKLQTEVKICEKCCSKNGTDYKGTKKEASTTIGGSISASINGLVFFPASRAVVIACKRSKIDIFAGFRISGSASGSINVKNECGEVSGGGSVSYSLTASGEVSASADEERIKLSISGSIEGTFMQEGTVTFSNTGTEKKCTTKWGAEAKFSYSIEYTYLHWKVSLSDSYTKDLGHGTSEACPFGL